MMGWSGLLFTISVVESKMGFQGLYFCEVDFGFPHGTLLQLWAQKGIALSTHYNYQKAIFARDARSPLIRT